MSPSLTSIVLRDEGDEPMGHVRYTPQSGWVWACALCPAASRLGEGDDSPVAAVVRAVDHIEAAHP